MSSHNPADSRYPANPGYRYNPRHDDRNDRMYDDRNSRSRSRSYTPPDALPRSRDQRYGSPGGIRSNPHDVVRSPPRGPTLDRRYDSGDRDYPASRDPRTEYQGRDHDEHRRSSRSPPRWRGRSGYTDRDREGYRSPPHDGRRRSYSRSRSQSRSRSDRRGRRPPYFGPESREVMMEGLPVEMNEDDRQYAEKCMSPVVFPVDAFFEQISSELKEHYHIEDLEDVRVIRDRHTKISRQLGFLRFPSLDGSRDFVEQNFPAIYLYGESGAQTDGRGTKVRIAYSREREDRNKAKGEGDWTCVICNIVNYAGRQRCFRCQAAPPELPQGIDAGEANATRVRNTGDNDVAPDGTPSQFVLLRGLEPSVSEELLAKGVAKLYKPAASSDGQAASIAAKKGAKVASTTGDSNLGAREGSIRRILLVRDRRSNESWRYGFAEFATVEDAQAALTRYNSFESFTISSKPVLASYIHAGVFVPVLNPSASTRRFTFSPLKNPSLKLAYWDEEAYVTELRVSTETVGTDRKKAGTGVSGSAKQTKDSEKVKKRKADAAATSGTKKIAVPSHLQFWSDRHAELHGIQRGNAEEEANTGDKPSSAVAGDSVSPPSASPGPTQSYADPNRMCCYLCMRQFKTTAEVNKHERLSQLHRDNMQNEELKAKAMEKLQKHGIIPAQPSTDYRDRAKERRRAFGPSTKPKQKKVTLEAEPEPAVPIMSKGASLLGKMGWSAGTGLGAQGTGMTAPVAADLYVQGVGLGAQGGKVGDAIEEVGRNTRGRYDNFLEKTKEGARERYERISRGEQ